MDDTHAHDHSQATHSAVCDELDCGYISMAHAHDEDSAVEALSFDLADHNKMSMAKKLILKK